MAQLAKGRDLHEVEPCREAVSYTRRLSESRHLKHIIQCYTVCHMKTISIRVLHEKTGEWIRQAGEYGEIIVTDRGRAIAKIQPQADLRDIPYFARRRISQAFRGLMQRGKLRGGADSTQIVSEDRDRRIS